MIATLVTRFRRLILVRGRRRVVTILAGAAVGFMAGLWWLVHDLPKVDQLTLRASPTTTKVYDRHGALLHEVLDPRAGRRTRVRLADIPEPLRQAVIAVEDAGFYGHPGVDWRGVVRAAWLGVREGHLVSGGSSITQQLARSLLMTPEERARRSVVRKLREMWLALAISRHYSKDAVLELYLNEVYFGHLAYGVEAASQTYFGKPARQLDLAESALLAGLIQSPADTDPLVFSDAAKDRQRVVLGLMTKAGLASAAAARAAGDEPLQYTGGRPAAHAPHFVGYVLDQLERSLGPDVVQRGGLSIRTTLDLDLQRAAEEAVDRHLELLNDPAPGQPRRGAGNAAVVALSPTSGEILAMVGSAAYLDQKIDGAVNMALSLRQPGSAFKPITYAAALGAPPAPGRNGYPALPFTAATVLSDVPTVFTTREGEPYRPRNYDRTWHGPITLRDALATSNNMVAVKVLDAVGLAPVLGLATRLGLDSLAERRDLGLSLTLGGAEVSPLDLTAAYGAFANGGYRVSPVSVLGVESAASPSPDVAVRTAGQRAMPAPVAYLVTDILADRDARVPAFGEGNVLELYGRPAAAKTGTTSNFRDNWTVGYTPDLVVGVWVGNADNTPMHFVTGISGAGPIWQAVMTAYHRGRPVHAFARPAGISEHRVCEPSGLLAGGDCPHTRVERFIAGTEPTRADDTFVAVQVDDSSGAVWRPGCHGTHHRVVFRRLPAQAISWGAANGIARPPSRTCRGEAIAWPASEQPWPGIEALAVGSTRMPARSQVMAGSRDGGGRGLHVLEPAAGATYSLVPGLDRDHQRLPIEVWADNAAEGREVLASIDGRAVCRWKAPPYRCFWPLALGTHQAVVSIGGDTSAPSQFSVVPMVVEE